jgi:hypothetical protein
MLKVMYDKVPAIPYLWTFYPLVGNGELIREFTNRCANVVVIVVVVCTRLPFLSKSRA